MKDFSEFADAIDIGDIKDGVETSLLEMKLTDKEKEIIGATCFGVALNLLHQYHDWLDS